MRVIIPPTGNEFIGMLKTTSLVAALPYTGICSARSQHRRGDLRASPAAAGGIGLVPAGDQHPDGWSALPRQYFSRVPRAS